MQLPGWCLCLAVLGVFHVVMRQSWSEMIFSGSHFGVINPFHPLLAKLSGLMMVSTCLCYHHCWLHPVRVRGEILLGLSGALDLGWLSGDLLTSLSYHPSVPPGGRCWSWCWWCWWWCWCCAGQTRPVLALRVTKTDWGSRQGRHTGPDCACAAPDYRKFSGVEQSSTIQSTAPPPPPLHPASTTARYQARTHPGQSDTLPVSPLARS